MSVPVIRTWRQLEADENGCTVIFNGVEIKCSRPPGHFLSESEVSLLTSAHTPPVESGFQRVEMEREWNVFEHRILLFTKDVEDRGDAHCGY